MQSWYSFHSFSFPNDSIEVSFDMLFRIMECTHWQSDDMCAFVLSCARKSFFYIMDLGGNFSSQIVVSLVAWVKDMESHDAVFHCMQLE